MRRLALLALAALLATGPALAVDYKAPRTSFGQPDLQGVWNTNFIAPLEAQPGVTQLTVPEAEAKVLAQRFAKDASGLAALALDPEVPDLSAASAKAGLSIVKGERRTRQVVLPASGEIPMTPRARGMVRAIDRVLKLSAEPPLPNNNPEDRPNWERCIVGQGQPPIAVTTSLNPRQIIQTRDQVAILTEYGPDLRIVPLTDQHGPAALTSALGDSIAHWEGETLVVETIRLPAKDTIRPFPTLLVSGQAKVIERYTRVGPDELLYQYTVVDPATYSGPWLAEYSLARQDHPILEFACHEGNYSLPNILAGARAKEADARAPRKPGGP